jgi:acetate CoA/acetoacetate CoA-transferase alpha subunit
MKSVVSPIQAVSIIPDGASVMVGGFMCCGQPLALVDALLEHGAKDLTIICNDAGLPGRGVAKLIAAGRVKHLIASHIGLNPEAGEKMNKGSMKVDLVPQGTLAERIRCAGAGLGGFLTPTGAGTDVEVGKQKITINAKEYLLETPLFADFALVVADVCDAVGNAEICKSRKNFNIVMAMAAKKSICESRKIVPQGALCPDRVNIPGVFVKSIVEVQS